MPAATHSTLVSGTKQRPVTLDMQAIAHMTLPSVDQILTRWSKEPVASLQVCVCVCVRACVCVCVYVCVCVGKMLLKCTVYVRTSFLTDTQHFSARGEVHMYTIHTCHGIRPLLNITFSHNQATYEHTHTHTYVCEQGAATP